MRHLFQFIDKKTGNRSKPFVMTSKQLADEIHARSESDDELDSYYVLNIADINVEGQIDINEAPLLLARSFLSTFFVHVTSISENDDD